MIRSEADKLAMTPLEVKLGTTTYKIELLRIRKQREWRTKLVDMLGSIMGNFHLEVEKVEVFQGGLISAMVHAPEKLADLIFLYAPDLPKETILDEATEEQIVTAFSDLLQVGFPFIPALQKATEILSAELSSSPKPGSSRLQ